MPSRFAALFTAAVLFAAISVPVFFSPKAHAAGQLQSRQLTISSSANGTITTDAGGNAVAAGSGGNGQKTKETFSFKIATTGNVGSVLILFCDDPIPQTTCLSGGGTLPGSKIAGFDAHNITAVNQTGWAGGAWSVDRTTNLTANGCVQSSGFTPARDNCIALTRTAASETAGTTVTLAFGGTGTEYITNPSSDNFPFYARISTYSDTAWTTQVDYGTVVGATAQQIDITAKVKEVLNFSVTSNSNNSDVTAPGTTCAPLGNAVSRATVGDLKLGDTNGVLSFNTAYDAHSYFRLSSNTVGGVNVYYSGDTLKKDPTNDINQIGTTAAFSQSGTEQFGLGIDSGDSTPNGYSFTNLTAAHVGDTVGSITDYNAANGAISTNGAGAKFAFTSTSMTSPVILAYSAGPVACDTGSVRYLGNISTATPAGIYTTTITYIATGTY